MASVPEGLEESKARTRQVFAYFAPLTILVYLATPGGYLLDIGTTYLLKNQFHASATQVAIFRLVTGIPLYFSFVFGLVRDVWSPFGLRDRGHILIFSTLAAAVYFVLAFSEVSYASLFAGILLVMFAYRFVSAGYQALLALVGQEQLMSGRLSALWQIFAALPYVVACFWAGYLSAHLRPGETFLIMGLLTMALGLFGLWKPRAVFSHSYDQPAARGSTLGGDIKRLLKHRAAYPAVLAMLLFSFAPGSNTPLQFYLTNNLHGSDAVYGYYNGIFVASFIPMFFVYGYLCKRVSLKKLLWWGTIVAIPQMIPLALIHTANLALVMAVPIGLLGGIASGAYYDLAMRACPPGLQGTLMMMVDGVYYMANRGSDILGARIYNASPAHGFLNCVIATTVIYALILPVLLLIPKGLIATADGQPNPAVAAEILKESAT
jgi:hypothetical protein